MRISISLCLLVACTGNTSPSGDDQPPDDVSPTAVMLTPAQHLTRVSMVLRGLRPSVEELRQVDADPSVLPAIVDRYLQSREFGQTIREMHNEHLLMEIEQPQFTYPALGPITTATARQINSIFEEPLRLIEDVVMSDQPYTKIVTADYTMANGTSAAIWGLAHTGGVDQWTRTTWTDGRPKAGILSMDVLYNRERSAGFNYHRGRANLISTALLCHDFLASDIMLDTTIDLADPDAVSSAVVSNATCAGCHQTLDPLASHFFTFRNQLAPVSVTAYPVTYYTPDTANRWMTATRRTPMFFGTPTGGFAGVGAAIAADPRFAKCAATRFASYFTEVARNDISAAWVARLHKIFVDSNYNAKELAKAVVLSDEFRLSHDTDEARAENTVGVLKIRPEQLHRMLLDLTGFSWSANTGNLRGIPYGLANLLESDFIGFRVLAGGIDAYFVTEPVHTMNATSSLVAKAAASAAADFVVDHDLAAAAGARTLFVEAGVGTTDEALIRKQLAYLHARLYGELVAPDSAEVDESLALYNEAFAATADRARAWKLTLVGMLSDFRSLFY